MSIETVRVTPAKFPPTINTTPNSPRVCAKLKTAAVTTPGSDNGRITRQNVRKPPAPSTADASSNLRSTPSNEMISGSATTDSSRNLPRQVENASQYANGVPITSNIAATHAASLIDKHNASIRNPFFYCSPRFFSTLNVSALTFFLFVGLHWKFKTILCQYGAAL